MKLSIIILAKNEAETIADCINTLTALNPQELLVIDDESSDKTAALAHRQGAKIIKHKKHDFAEARNFALKQAMSDWVLYVDADEYASEGLVQEITEAVSNPKFVAYSLPRINYYLGKKWPKTENVIRLFKKLNLKGWFGELHESPQVDGSVGTLTQPLNHHTHRSLSEMVANTIVWSGIEAKLRFEAHHPPVSWWRLPRVMLPTFWDYFVQQGGWKVGTVGLIESMYQTFSIFLTYARLWELQQRELKHEERRFL